MRSAPARTFEDKMGQAFSLTPELRTIALDCGRAFGVELFAVDVMVSEGRPYVVNVQSFPGFKGVPEAALRLADYVYTAAQNASVKRAAERRTALQLVPPVV
jgi:ribosomal protein S6--L-glutamate ligase